MPLVEVRNYTAELFGEVPVEVGMPFSLAAFSCANDLRGGEFDYFYYPFSRVGNDTYWSEINGAADESGPAASPGEYEFELESTAEISAPIALVPQPDQPFVFAYQDDLENLLPTGIYVFRGLITGSVSEPFHFGPGENYAEFFFYIAAPAPTPTPTETPVPTETATPTETPEVPADLVATDTSVLVVPGGIIMGDLTYLVSGSVPPYTFTVGTLPTQGTVVINPDGTFTYTANVNAAGIDSFTYIVTDSQAEVELSGAATDTGTATITIVDPDETPTATSTSVVGPGDPDVTSTSVDPRATTTSGGGPVSELPSTGQGQDGGASSFTLILLLSGLAMLTSSALYTRKRLNQYPYRQRVHAAEPPHGRTVSSRCPSFRAAWPR